ncbi:hypothetical protein [Lelliottia sp. CFBP8978]|uniref:hypothetical protein n=1 Tax=Lelliottia sp. CFBP8978 TaxID=3096522 RepID=UPI002A6A5B43|nr:hypothetical protein [Lelliottia sp. CFBP8978]MDY1038629.1 hypothetical protein [Lelliottia sp. CFBP8978]
MACTHLSGIYADYFWLLCEMVRRSHGMVEPDAEPYFKNLEMMYFLIEPLFIRANALKAQYASDREIADIIIRMIR